MNTNCDTLTGRRGTFLAACEGPSFPTASLPPQTSTSVDGTHVDPLGPLNLSAHLIQGRVASPLLVHASESRRDRPVENSLSSLVPTEHQ